VIEKSSRKDDSPGAHIVLKKEDVLMWETRIPARRKE
jgi:hypothetical protein